MEELTEQLKLNDDGPDLTADQRLLKVKDDFIREPAQMSDFHDFIDQYQLLKTKMPMKMNKLFGEVQQKVYDIRSCQMIISASASCKLSVFVVLGGN